MTTTEFGQFATLCVILFFLMSMAMLAAFKPGWLKPFGELLREITKLLKNRS